MHECRVGRDTGKKHAGPETPTDPGLLLMVTVGFDCNCRLHLMSSGFILCLSDPIPIRKKTDPRTAGGGGRVPTKNTFQYTFMKNVLFQILVVSIYIAVS
ncbi:hypothetical protein XELAEV_18044103mg [Xenopus laevis]|uniref:Uncharacterized protein n=1 Tax=Xenopus laevis TaxID=8355 RepID=A0A974BY76_XENLA|nr:hypothetical protein XELAEV_18044103mg [Xenopus laevis]